MRDETGPDWLPDLIECNWNRFQETIDRAYAVFLRDFGTEAVRPLFRGKRMGLKKHPEYDGKSATFWHFVTEGRVEAHRYPVRERIERIAWPKALLLETDNDPARVLVWANERRRSTHAKSKRWVISLEDFSYVVVVDEREDYMLPWTAFSVMDDHRRLKLRKEYNVWKNTNKG